MRIEFDPKKCCGLTDGVFRGRPSYNAPENNNFDSKDCIRFDFEGIDCKGRGWGEDTLQQSTYLLSILVKTRGYGYGLGMCQNMYTPRSKGRGYGKGSIKELQVRKDFTYLV